LINGKNGKRSLQTFFFEFSTIFTASINIILWILSDLIQFDALVFMQKFQKDGFEVDGGLQSAWEGRQIGQISGQRFHYSVVPQKIMLFWECFMLWIMLFLANHGL
jgi:hypothetical protein